MIDRRRYGRTINKTAYVSLRGCPEWAAPQALDGAVARLQSASSELKVTFLCLFFSFLWPQTRPCAGHTGPSSGKPKPRRKAAHEAASCRLCRALRLLSSKVVVVVGVGGTDQRSGGHKHKSHTK